jgi:hypothetical protein
MAFAGRDVDAFFVDAFQRARQYARGSAYRDGGGKLTKE